MPRAETLLLFGVAAAVLIAIPGPSAIYVVTRALSEGRCSGAASALGVETGDAIHVAAAAVGLSALVASSAHALSIVKYVGAAYLVYLGIRHSAAGLTSTPTPAASPAPLAASTRRAYSSMFLTPRY